MRPVEHRVIADSAIKKEMGYYSMGLVFGVRIFCYGMAGRARTLNSKADRRERELEVIEK